MVWFFIISSLGVCAHLTSTNMLLPHRRNKTSIVKYIKWRTKAGFSAYIQVLLHSLPFSWLEKDGEIQQRGNTFLSHNSLGPWWCLTATSLTGSPLILSTAPSACSEMSDSRSHSHTHTHIHTIELSAGKKSMAFSDMKDHCTASLLMPSSKAF